MRILHISKFSYPVHGGIETFVNDLSCAQAQMGHDVKILCHHDKANRKTSVNTENGVTVTRVMVNCNLSFAPLSFSFSKQLKKEINSSKPDVIHMHLPNTSVFLCNSVPENIPCIIHWHADVQGSSNPCIKLLYPFYRFFEQRCLSKADRIIVTSPPYLEASSSLIKWKNKCSIIPLGLNTGRYPELKHLRQNPPMVLSVGRFAYYKGFEYIVRAASRLPEVKFIIAGDGPNYDKIKTEVEKRGLTGRVILPGRVTDSELHSLLQKASLFCLPSIDRAEAFGVVLLEAMTYSIPIISTSISGSGTGWVNKHEVTGLVVPPKDPASLAEAIKTVLSDSATAAEYGNAGRIRLEEKFKIDQVAKKIDRLYRQVIES